MFLSLYPQLDSPPLDSMLSSSYSMQLRVLGLCCREYKEFPTAKSYLPAHIPSYPIHWIISSNNFVDSPCLIALSV